MAYDFPNAPTIGQVANGYTWDGEKWVTNFSTPNPGGVIAIKVFTASGTYTPSPNMSSCVIECVGGGGGGGGAYGGEGPSAGGGGGSGAYARKFATAADVGSSQPVTIGAGAGGWHWNGAAANGETTSVGALCSAVGGYSGAGSRTSFGVGQGGWGGTTGTGDIVVPGGAGGGGSIFAAGYAQYGGVGGSSYFSGGPPGIWENTGASALPNSGAGGAGSMSGTANTWNGGNGGSGLVVITEYGLTSLTGNSVSTAVRYDIAQTLTTPQQLQARTNINAPSFTDINAAVNPIPKNYVINGAMMVSQENGAVAGSVNGFYPADQFVVITGGTTGVLSAQQVASVTPGNSPNRIRVTCTTADAAVAASDYVTITQVIEGYRMADLRYGAAGALQTTLRFGVRAPAGTYGVCFQNAGAARSYVATFTITAGQTNTDTVQSITIPGDITGTWNKNNNIGMYIQWCLMGGTTYQTTVGWKAGNFLTTSAQYNLMGATARVFELFDVGLYIGATAPPFLVPDYADELQLCKRYWNYYPYMIALSGYADTNIHDCFLISPMMRAAPMSVFTVGSGGGQSNISAFTMDSTDANSFTTIMTPIAPGRCYNYFGIKLNARM